MSMSESQGSSQQDFGNANSIIPVLRMNYQQRQPIIRDSPSDVKPPTIEDYHVNSSFPIIDPIRSYISHRDLDSNLHPQRKSKTLNAQTEDVEIKFLQDHNDYEEPLRGSRRHIGIIQNQLAPNIDSHNIFIRHFVKNIMKQSYIFRPQYLTNQQKSLLQEVYLMDIPLEDSVQKSNLIIDPFDNFNIIWQAIQIILIIFQCIYLPLHIAFDITIVIGVEILIIVLFAIDIPITLNTAYIESGKQIKERNLILKRYFNSECYLDVCSLTVQILIGVFNAFDEFDILLLFLYYITIYNKLVKGLEYFNLDHDWLRFSLFFIILTHSFACLWYIVGDVNSDSWVSRSDLQFTSNLTKYLNSYHWTIQTLTTIGYGDLKVHTDLELFSSIIIMYISCAAFIYCLNFTGSAIHYRQQKQQKSRTQMSEIVEYLNHNKISREMKSRIRSYLHHYAQQEAQTNEDNLQKALNNLNVTLKQDLLNQIRIRSIRQCKLFRKFSNETIQKIPNIMEGIRLQPGEEIFKLNQNDDHSLYLIESGVVQIHLENRIIETLKIGDHFGVWGFFTGSARKASAKSVGFVKLYRINQNAFKNILSTSEDKEFYHVIKQSLLLYNRVNIVGMNCYCCKSPNHLIVECPILNYQPDKERVLLQDAYYTPQQRQPLQRFNHRDQNRCFKYIFEIEDAVNLYKMKYNLDPHEEYTDSMDEDEVHTDYDTDNLGTDNQGQRSTTNEKAQDGTVVSILKNDLGGREQSYNKQPSKILQELQSDQDSDIADLAKMIRPQVAKGTLGTAQFQQQVEEQNLLKLALNNKRQTDFFPQLSSIPMDSVNHLSSNQIAAEQPIPSVKRIPNQPHLTFAEEGSSPRTQKTNPRRSIQPIKKSTFLAQSQGRARNLAQIREVESESINLSLSRRKSSDGIDATRKLTKNTLISPDQRPPSSFKRISSKLSTIPIRQPTTNHKSTFGTFHRGTTMQFQTQALVDLSQYKKDMDDNEDHEFDKMYNYTKYFPINNAIHVVQRFNVFNTKRAIKNYIYSPYTFYQFVKNKSMFLKRYFRDNPQQSSIG